VFMNGTSFCAASRGQSQSAMASQRAHTGAPRGPSAVSGGTGQPDIVRAAA